MSLLSSVFSKIGGKGTLTSLVNQYGPAVAGMYGGPVAGGIAAGLVQNTMVTMPPGFPMPPTTLPAAPKPTSAFTLSAQARYSSSGRFDPTGPWGDEGEVPAGYRRSRTGRIVKIRRMNPTNPKALRRAVRRLTSYSRLNKRVEKSLRRLAPPRRSAPRRLPAPRRGGTSIVNVD